MNVVARFIAAAMSRSAVPEGSFEQAAARPAPAVAIKTWRRVASGKSFGFKVHSPMSS
jgi:hypothetical protein